MKISKVLAPVTSLASSMYLASSVFAQDAGSFLTGIGGVSGDLLPFVKGLINWAIGLAALVCVGILIFSGYMYITAAGDENKVEKATKSLTGAIIGLVICFVAVILVQFVLNKILVGAK